MTIQRTNKPRIRAAALLLALLLPLAAAADTPPAPAPTKTPRRPHLREILKQLNLTHAQKKQLAEARASFRKKMAELDGQLKVKQVELENEMEKSDPDQQKVTELTQAIGDLLGRRMLEKAEATIALETQILTPQQADQLKSFQPDTSSESDAGF